MAKRQKHTPQRSHVYQQGQTRPGFSRKQPQGPAKSGPPWWWIGIVALGIVVILAGGAYLFGLIPGFGPSASPTPAPTAVGTPRPSFDVHPPIATPLASPPAEPSGDGTTATIETDLGNIVMELYTESSPVAA